MDIAMRHPLRPFFNVLYRFHPPEMVQWWKNTDAVRAKATFKDDGSYEMYMGTEKYPFAGFPRGHLLFGSLSPLKHEIKNQVFNDSWAKLEKGEDIVADFKGPIFDNILELGEKAKYDMFPVEKQVPAVREIHRAWTEVSKGHSQETKLNKFRDIVCFILNEDDGYRFRFQWLVQWFPMWVKRNPLKYLERALSMLEHGENINDMKERQVLLKRVAMALFDDPGIREWFNKFAREIDWKLVKLTKADKYYFRAKYFKVDYKRYDY